MIVSACTPGGCARSQGGAAPVVDDGGGERPVATNNNARVPATADTSATPKGEEAVETAKDTPEKTETGPIAIAEEVPPIRRKTDWSSPTTNGVKRIAEARAAKLDVVKGLFSDAKVAFPPGQILFRGFKKEGLIEVWAATATAGPLTHVTTYEICYASGELGPKRKEGDRQVPEGFYTVNLYNPASSYHLAMQVSYPNLSDRILGDKRKPGSEIMIHGNCVSIGCMAMSDERSQEIYLEATSVGDRGGTVHVHLFPARDMAALLTKAEYKTHAPFWENIKEGLDYFKQKRVLPRISIDKEGRYHFSDP